MVILFIASLVGLAIWSWIYCSYAAHYFLVTIIDSSAGIDEIRYPSELIVDLWWKPAFCLWVLVFCLMTGSAILTPCMLQNTTVSMVLLAVIVWLLYPLGLLSALASHRWFHVVHPPVIWKLLRQYQAFAYVNLITLLSMAVCAGFLAGVFGHSFLWALPAAFVLPTALLMYARHWGQFAWFALHEPVKKKKRRRRRPPEPEARQVPGAGDIPGETATAAEDLLEPEVLEEEEGPDENVPEMEIEEADPAAAGIYLGLPPVFPHAIKAGLPVSHSEGIQAGPPPQPVAEEPEDEWSTDKKPYAVIDEPPQPPAPAGTPNAISSADQPISIAQFYDDQAKKEKEDREKKEAKRALLPPGRKHAPTFRSALVDHVWVFMIYAGTIQVWINLVALTIVELFFLAMVVRFWPSLD